VTLEFTTDTDETSASGNNVTSTGFANQVTTANTEMGANAPLLSTSTVLVQPPEETVTDADESNSSESSSSSSDSGMSGAVSGIIVVVVLGAVVSAVGAVLYGAVVCIRGSSSGSASETRGTAETDRLTQASSEQS